MNNWAEKVLSLRIIFLVIVGIVTLIAGSYALNISFKTVYEEILPQHDPYIDTHLAYEGQYGGPLTIKLILESQHGSIYQAETIKKIKAITEALDATPHVNHDQVFSIASRKVRRLKIDEYGASSIPLLPGDEALPQTKQQLEDFSELVDSTPGVLGTYVSFDKSSAYFQASLVPGEIDYLKVFNYLNALSDQYSNDSVTLHMFGQPVLTGWVYTYNAEVIQILSASFILMLVLLQYFSKNIRMVLLAGITSLISAVWGLGFVGVLGWSMDPLILVIPMLVMARTLSHSVQMGMRYLEIAHEVPTTTEACVLLLKKQFKPGVLGIVTDAAGIFLIAVADIPMMQKLAVFAGIWSLSVIVTVLIMMPLMISFLKPVAKQILSVEDHNYGLTKKILSGIFYLSDHKVSRVIVWFVFIVLTTTSLWISKDLQIGEIEPGTSLLWPDSSYNQAVTLHTNKFIGPDELLVVVEARPEASSDGKRADYIDVRDLSIIKKIQKFQYMMQNTPDIKGSLSFVDLLPSVKRSLSGNHPKFEVLPLDGREAGQLTSLLQANAAPGDFDYLFDKEYKNASVRFFVPDHKAETVNRVIDKAKKVISELEASDNSPGKIRMAAGSIGIASATNNEVSNAQSLNFLLTTLVIIIAIWLGYRSFSAVLILITPLLFTDVIVAAIMVKLGISINVNTLPILSVGMGIGIDYGIYLLSRTIEEAKRGVHKSTNEAVHYAILTSGRAIFITAITMVFAVGIWYFMSNLRFQADMGLLLALIMIINCLGALILIPLAIHTFKPNLLKASN
ncbi:MAG: MMPL family transporter [Cycloclasticus sp.]|nr:MMPL family transporter [Cycloclasticus sp.]